MGFELLQQPSRRKIHFALPFLKKKQQQQQYKYQFALFEI